MKSGSENCKSKVIKNFEKSSKPIFVIYGKVYNFDKNIKEFESYFQNQNAKVVTIDIKLIKPSDFADTFFEVISLFGDELIKKIDEIDKENLDDILRSFRNKYRQIIDKPEDDKLVKLSGFYEYVLSPLLENILDSKGDINIIFKGFEQVSEWGSKLNTHFFEKLSEIISVIILNFSYF